MTEDKREPTHIPDDCRAGGPVHPIYEDYQRWRQMAEALADILLKVLSTSELCGGIDGPHVERRLGTIAYANLHEAIKLGNNLIDEVDNRRGKA